MTRGRLCGAALDGFRFHQEIVEEEHHALPLVLFLCTPNKEFPFIYILACRLSQILSRNQHGGINRQF